MAKTPTQPYDEQKLLDCYRVYDTAVDVVSALQFLFTGAKDLKDTVDCFDRYPKLRGTDRAPATPDFTVLFKGPAAVVGEIARFGLPDESVDSLCRQIGRYETIPSVKGEKRLVKPQYIDVLLLVPAELGTEAVRRIIRERYQNRDNSYKPQRPPCIVQWSRSDELYVFQRLGEPENGRLREEGRIAGLNTWLDKGSVKIRAGRFKENKAAYAFMNDPVDPLYLATTLWSKTFADMARAVLATVEAGGTVPLRIEGTTLAGLLHKHYGTSVTVTDIRRAMNILVACKLADSDPAGGWTVAWGPITLRGGENELHRVLAGKAATLPHTGPITRLRKAQRATTAPRPPPPEFQTTLFSTDDI